MIQPVVLWQPLEKIMERAIGANDATIQAEIKSGSTSPLFMTGGADGSNDIPPEFLPLYDQLYNQAASIPKTTGLAYDVSLAAGGTLDPVIAPVPAPLSAYQTLLNNALRPTLSKTSTWSID